MDLTVMLADGGGTISDLAVLRDQADVFGPVASPATAWRVLDAIDESALARIRAARAAARELAWAQHAETRGAFPQAEAAGRRIAEHWPWAKDLATAFQRLIALPRPITT